MEEKKVNRLAVARLDELTEAHRYHEDQPMHGFCLISGDQTHCRVTLYIENGRALTDRTGRAGFYYEGWLIGPEGPVSLGAFNLGPGGQGATTRLLEGATLPPGRSDLVRVTAEPYGGTDAGSVTVLEGRLIRLDTGSAAPEPIAPEAQLVAEAAWEQSPQAEPVTLVMEPVLQTAAVESAFAGSGAGGPASLAEPAVAQASMPAPAPEPRSANPLELNLKLTPRHPMAPRAAGAAVLNLRQGALTLTLRGLPSPTAMGRDPFTDRPFNAYRVWLVNQQTGIRTPAGYCQRAWGENFRFEADSLPLTRHDTVLVTVEDRTALAGNTASPQVLIASYTA